jgi:hypothetical protein
MENKYGRVSEQKRGRKETNYFILCDLIRLSFYRVSRYQRGLEEHEL